MRFNYCSSSVNLQRIEESWQENPVERMAITCIRNNIAVFAIHTNLDNVLTGGVNRRICDKLKVKKSCCFRTKEATNAKVSYILPG